MTPYNHMNSELPFLEEGGEMGRLMRERDWNATLLGHPSGWPAQLKQLTATMLNTHSPMLICWGKEYVQLYNDAYRPILGIHKHPQSLGICVNETYSEIWETLEPLFAGVMKGRSVTFQDFKLDINRNGYFEDLYFDFSYSGIKDENGAIIGVLVICQETTQKVNSLRTLSESEERFRTMAEGTNLLIGVSDETSKVTYANKSWIEFTGKPFEDHLNFDWASLLHPEDRSGYIEAYLNAFKNREPFTDEFRLLNKDGTYRWLFAQVTPRLHDDGTFAGYISACIDITDRKEVEAERQSLISKLYESDVKLSQAMEVGGIGSWKMDPQTQVIELSDFVKTIFGITGKKIKKLDDLLQILNPEHAKIVSKAIDDAINNELPGDIEFPFTNPLTGKKTWVRTTGRIFKDEEGNVTDYFGMVLDITDRVLHQQELEDFNEKMSRVNTGLVEAQQTMEELYQAMSESENKFKSIIQKAQVAIAIFTGPELIIDLYNEKVLEYWGRTASEVAGKSLFEVLPDSTGQGYDELAGKVYEKGERLVDNEIPVTLNGNGVSEITWVNFIYDPVRDVKGNISGIIVVCTDVTNQVNARKEIENALEQLRLSKEAAQVGTFDLDLVKGTMEWDERCRELFGIRHKNKVSYEKDFVEGLHHEDREHILNVISNAFIKSVSGGDYDVEYRTVGADDQKIRWVKAKGKVYFDQHDQPIRFIGSVLDITEQINSMKKLEQSENRFRSLIEEAPVATCFFIGRELKIEIANQRMINIWGKGDSVIGKPFGEALPELKNQPFLEILDEVFVSGKAYEAKAMRADLLMDGVMRTFYFDFTYKPFFNAEGAVYGIMDMAIDVTEQVLIQQRINQTQKELFTLFDQSPVGIAILSKGNFTFKMANRFYGTLVDRNPDDLLGRPLLEALPELAGQGFEALLENVLHSGIPYLAPQVPVVLRRGGKLETIYVDLTYQPLRDADDSISSILVVCTDVTLQVVSRMEIEKNEAKLRSIISSAPAGISLFVGRDLIIENPNQTFIDIVGKGPEIEGLPIREVMPELLTENQPFLHLLDEVFTTGIEFQSPGSLVKIMRDGVMTTSYYNITYTPLFNAEGEVYAILDISIDVTEQLKAQQALEEAEIELRGAIELAGLATWIWDIKGEKFIYSPRFMKWLGFSEDTKGLDEAYNPLPEGFRQSVPAALQAVCSPESNGFYDNEHPIVNRITGQTRIIHAQGQVFYDETGAPLVLRGTARDITLERKLQIALEAEVKSRTKELNDANQDLIKSNAELAQFAYIASHDLQEPLRKISTFSQMLEKSLGSDINVQSQNFLSKIKNSSSRMATLISDVLKYSQLVKENETFEPVDLNAVIKNTIADYDLLIDQKKAIVNAGDLPVIEAIPLQMSQLFGNLMGNALKFSRKEVDPVITISASQLKPQDHLQFNLSPNLRYVKITFADNGIGLDPQYAEKIFHIFQRLHRKSEYEGTGIGLAMCKKIALNHHGDISAGGGNGNGATFSIVLPLKQITEQK